MAHKMDLGFHRYNIQQTLPDAFASRAPGRRSSELLTTQIGNSIVRSLPVDDSSGYVDVPESNPTDPSKRTVSEEALLPFSGQGSGITGATQPPQQMMGPGHRSTLSKQGSSPDHELLNAHFYPSMPSSTDLTAAHNAAHCEPIPGDWPDPAPEMKPIDAVSPDELLDTIHAQGVAHAPGSGPVGGTSAGAARDDSSQAAHGATDQQQQVGDLTGAELGGHSASKPADDPDEIKAVVREETLSHRDAEGSGST